jgi:iron complex outermembrane receptor protein
MLYASYVRGYKGPAFDTSLVAAGSYVKPETSDAWEAGLKSSWFDRRLILNIAAFYAEYQDFQAEAYIDDNPDDLLLGSFLVVNAGEVTTKGVEVDFLSRPTDDWVIGGGMAYTDGTIEDFPKGNCSAGQKFRGECPGGFQDLSGGELPYTPKWKLTLHTTYNIGLENAPFDLILGANLRTQDDVLYDIAQDEYSWQDAYTVVDVSTTLAGKEQKYRVTAFVKNLLDEDYATLIFAQAQEVMPNGYLHSVPKYAQRTAGIEVRLDF